MTVHVSDYMLYALSLTVKKWKRQSLVIKTYSRKTLHSRLCCIFLQLGNHIENIFSTQVSDAGAVSKSKANSANCRNLSSIVYQSTMLSVVLIAGKKRMQIANKLLQVPLYV